MSSIGILTSIIYYMNSDPNLQSSQSTHQPPTPPPPTPCPTASSRHTKQVIDRIQALVFAVLSLYCRLSLEECRKQEEQSKKEMGMKDDGIGDQEAIFRGKLRASFVGVLDGIVQDYQRAMGKKDNCGEVIAFLTNSMTLPEKYVTRYSQTKYEQSCKKVFKTQLSLIYPKIEQLVNWLLAYLLAKDPISISSSLPLTDPQKQAEKQQLNNLTTIFTMFLSEKKKLDPSENEHNFYYIKILKCKGKLGLDEEFIRKWVGLKRDIAKERTGRAVQFVKVRVGRLRVLMGKLEKIREKEQQVYPFQSEKSKSETVSDKEKSKPQAQSSQHTQLQQPPSSHQPPLHPQPPHPHPQPRAQKLLKHLLTIYKAPQILTQRTQIVRILHEAQTLLIKSFLRRLLSMAKLRNYRYNSALWGDQRRCFGEGNQEAVGEIVVKRGKGFGVEDGGREGRKEMRFYQVRYPSRLEAYFQLRSNEQKHQQHLFQHYKTLQQKPSTSSPLKIRLPTLKAYLFENEKTTKQPIEPVFQETSILSTRLKITVAMVKDALLDLYPHGEVFGAERALYRS